MTSHLRNILACPACHGGLHFTEGGVTCENCSSSYLLHPHGPLNFLAPDNASDLARSTVDGLSVSEGMSTVLKDLALRMTSSHTFKVRAQRERIGKIVSSMEPGFSGVNIGSGSTNYGDGFINLDIAPLPGVHVLSVSHALPVKSASVDLIICQAALEHIRDTEATLNEARRVLKPNGVIYVEIPFMQPYHAGPDDYYRFTINGIEALFPWCRLIEKGVAVGPASAFSLSLRTFLALLFSGNNRGVYKGLHFLLNFPTFWIKYFDCFLARHPMSHVLASGCFYLGRKR